MPKQEYLNNYRRIMGKAEMTFYDNSSDDDATVSANFLDPNDTLNWRNQILGQLISTGLEPKYRYATPDGHNTLLNGSCHLYNASPQTLMALWSTSLSNNYCTIPSLPEYIQTFNELRKISNIKIIGDKKWGQGPLMYLLEMYVRDPQGEETEGTNTYPGFFNVGTVSPTASAPVTIDGQNYTKLTFPVTFPGDINTQNPTACVSQVVHFDKSYQVIKCVLRIVKWNTPYATAKIMYFSNDTKVTFYNDELNQIKVLEEKIENIDDLSYGITSNYCEVSVSNQTGRFTQNPDLLKKNRIIKPFIQCENSDTWDNLGVFYSDTWEVSSSSKYVKCKAYDVLYNLQKMYLFYPMVQNADGSHSIEGGTTVDKYYLPDDMKNQPNVTASAYTVFYKLCMLINENKKANGIYGSEVKFIIDDELKNVKLDYVLLGYDTAWNMLKEMANLALSFIYVDRDGNICVERDEFQKLNVPANALCEAQIDENNAFSYNMPTMSRTIVNRIIIPYFEEKPGEQEKITIKSSDYYANIHGKLVAKVNLKGFYKKIANITQYADNSFNSVLSPNHITEIKYTFNTLEITFDYSYNPENPIGVPEEIYIKVNSNTAVELEEKSFTLEDKQSQKKNGVVEFKLEPGKTVYGKTLAQNIAKTIQSGYGSGKSYIESEWIGSPEIKLRSYLKSKSPEDPDYINYEAVSNEITLSNGLRFNTKARQI